jgi:hypothetical protein
MEKWGLSGDGKPDVSRADDGRVSRKIRDSGKFVEESLHPKVVEHLSVALVDLQLGTKWEGYVRLDKPWMDAKFVRVAALAGLKKVYVGLELLEGENRSVFDKGDRPDIDRFLKLMADNGILVHLFVLVGHPGTTLDDALATMDYAFERKGLIDTLEVNGFRYERHTQIEGLTRNRQSGHDWALFDPYDSSLDPTYDQEAVDRMEDLLFRNYSYINPTWSHPIYNMISPWVHR